MLTEIHFTSGEKLRVDEDLATLQGKLTGSDVWAVIETQNGQPVAVRLDQVTFLQAIGTGVASH
jgi:hypothetical protein